MSGNLNELAPGGFIVHSELDSADVNSSIAWQRVRLDIEIIRVTNN